MSEDNADMEKCIDILSNRGRIFVSGEASSGKSQLIHAVEKHEKEEGMHVLLTAPSGIAAENIGGITCHAALAVRPSQRPQYPTALNISRLIDADLLIIDEISMISGEFWTFITKCIECADEARRKMGRSPIRVMVVGDFGQLPPARGTYAFMSYQWRTFGFENLKLKKVYRQDDTKMVKNLQKIRLGDRSGLGFFENYTSPVEIYDDMENTVTLCGFRRTADKYNQLAVDQARLSGKEIVNFYSQRIWAGAKVVFRLNDEMGRFCNGDRAIVKAITEDDVLFELKRDNAVIQLSRRMDESKQGRIYERPLFTLGYALTCHLAQGQTFDRANIIIKEETENSRCEIFTFGQLYVALSRVRTLGGIRILGDIHLPNVLASAYFCNFETNLQSAA